MDGIRLASIVLPVPGGPTIRTLWPPATATSMARFAWEKVIDNYDGELEKLAAGQVLY